MERICIHAQYQDTKLSALRQGLTFELPPKQADSDWNTALWHHTHYRFWEAVIEEKEGDFLAPFWIQVTGDLMRS